MSARPVADSAANPGAAAPGDADSAGETAADRLFLEAVDREDPADRAALLDARCEGDPALRAEVEGLLAAHGAVGGVLDRTLDGGPTKGAKNADAAGSSEAAEFPPLPETLGDYRVLEAVGRGGMGVVWRARDRRLDRIVAIKALAPELAADPVARRRFVREARAAAAVTHPHVVTIHAVEPDGPTPFLVMEYVAGRSLKEKLDADGPLELRETLRIGAQIAAGLAAAHERGLIHRDVKPGNVLLENGVERVKLTDFGLARAADDVALTRTGQIAGTPQYMSPEQAEGKSVDVRSDLFSLGGVLYAMGAGRPPFRGDSTLTVLRGVCDLSPRPLREENPEVPPWLAALVERLLAKNPDDRGLSAAEVAALLNRRLTELENPGLPTLPESEAVQSARSPLPAPARRPARGRRLRRWAIAAAVLAASLVGMGAAEATGVTEIVPTVVRLVRGEGVLAIAVSDPNVGVTIEGEDLLITGAGAGEIRLKPGAYTVKGTRDGEPVFQEVITVERNGRELVNVRWEPKDGAHRGTARSAPRAVEELAADAGAGRSFTLLRQFEGHLAHINHVAFYDGGRKAVSGDGDLRTWDVASGELLRTTPLGGWVMDFALTPDDRFAIASVTNRPVALKVDLETGEVVRQYALSGGGRTHIAALALTPDGSRLVAARQEGDVAVLDAATGRELHTVTAPERIGNLGGAVGSISVAVSPDGTRAAVGWHGGGRSGEVHVWDLSDGTLLATVAASHRAITALAFSREGERLMVGDSGGQVVLIDAADGRVRQRFEGHAEAVGAVVFLPDGRRAVTGGESGLLCLWDLETGRELARIDRPGRALHNVAVSPDGRRLLTGGGGYWDGTRIARTGDYALRLWAIPPSRGLVEASEARGLNRAGRRPDRSPQFVPPYVQQDLGRTPIRTTDAAGEPDDAALTRVQRFAGHTDTAKAVAVSPDGKLAASASGWPEGDRTARVWDLATGQQRSLFKHPGGVFSVAFSPDSSTLLTACVDGNARAFDLTTGNQIRQYQADDRLLDATYTPDGSKVVACSTFAAAAYVWDAASGELLHTLKHPTQLVRVEVTADGTRIVAVDHDGRLALWDLETGAFLKNLPESVRRQHASVGLALFGDSRRAVASGYDGVVHCWDLDSGAELWSLDAGMTMHNLAVSPDGRTVIAVGGRGYDGARNLAVIEAPADDAPGRLRFARHYQGGTLWAAAFTPDGERLLTSNGSRENAQADRARGGVAFDDGFALNLWDLPKTDGRPNRAAVDRGPRFLPPRVGVNTPQPPGAGPTAVRRFDGHTAAAKAVAVSPDGALVASASGWPDGDRTARLWDLSTGEPRHVLEHPSAVLDVAFSPDGARLLTGAVDGVARVFDVQTGEQLQSLRGTDVLIDVAYSPDGSQVLAASHHGEAVYVWDAETGDAAHVLKHERERPVRAAFTPDGTQVVAADAAGQLLIWNLADGAFVKALPETMKERQMDNVGLALLPEGRALVGDNAGLVRLWDLDRGEPVWSVMTGVTAIQAIAVSPDGATALIAGGAGPGTNRSLALLDVATGRKRWDRAYESGFLWDVAYVPDGRRFVAVAGSTKKDGAILPTGDFDPSLWELPSADGRPDWAAADRTPQFVPTRVTSRSPRSPDVDLSLVRRLTGHTAPAKSVAVSPDGALVASGSGWPEGDKTARVWETETGRELHVFKHPAGVGSVAFSPDGKRLLTGSMDGVARAFDLETGEELRQYVGTNILADVCYSPDGSLVLGATLFGESVPVWDANTGHVVHLLKHERRRPARVEVTPDGRQVVAVDDSGQLLIWRLDDGTFVKALPAAGSDRRGAVGLALSPDGRQAMTGDNAGLVRLWDLESGEQLWSIMSGITAIQGIAVSPDGATALAVGGAGPTGSRAAAAIDWTTGEKRLELGYEGGFLWDAAFLPDGERFVTVSGSRWMGENALPTGDNAVSLWEFSSARPAADRPAAAAPEAVTPEAVTPGNTARTDQGPRRTGGGPQFVQPRYPTFGPEGPRQNEAALSLVRRFEGHDAAPAAVAVSPDGTLIASGSGRPIGDRTARVWDMATGESRQVFQHPAAVLSVAFSPDGKTLLTGAADGVARAFDVNSGEESRQYDGSGPLTQVAFAPDGSRALGRVD